MNALRYRVAVAVRNGGYALAAHVCDVAARAHRALVVDLAPRIRGEFGQIAARIAPCGCEQGIAFFCSKKRRDLVAPWDCTCACHRPFDEADRQRWAAERDGGA